MTEHELFAVHFKVPADLYYDEVSGKHFVRHGVHVDTAKYVRLCQVAIELDRQWIAWDARARLAAEQPATVAVPDECPHMIVFDDADREPLVFAGSGARNAALKVWEQISNSWNAHLFVRIERNSRDDRYPSPTATAAPAAPVAVGQEPVAWDVFYDDDDRLAHTVRTKVEADRYASMAYYVKPLYYTAPPAAEQPPKAPMHPGVHYGRCPHTLATNSACRECRDKYGAGFDYRQPSAAEQPWPNGCPCNNVPGPCENCDAAEQPDDVKVRRERLDELRRAIDGYVAVARRHRCASILKSRDERVAERRVWIAARALLGKDGEA